MNDIITGIIAGVGGGGVIVLGLSKWIGEMWADRFIQNKKAEIDLELESYRVKLQRATFLFEKEFEAVRDFSSIFSQVLPDKGHPDMEWEDACEVVALHFETHRKVLKEFMIRHRAVLDEETSQLIDSAMCIASEGIFQLPEDNLSSMGDLFYKHLKDANGRLIFALRSQSAS